MTEGARGKLVSSDLIAARTEHRRRLGALFAGGAMYQPFRLLGRCHATEQVEMDPQAWLDGALEDLASHADAAADFEVFRPLLVCYNPRGVHFVDHLFGAQTFQMPDGSWQTHTLSSPVGALEPPDLESNSSWLRAQEVALCFLEAAPESVDLVMPTLSSALNIGVNLYGGRLLEALVL